MKSNLKDGWVPKWRQNMPKGWYRPQPTKPSFMSNKQRFEAQRKARDEERQSGD